MELKIGDHMWHPCNVDIIEYKVIAIHKFETETDKGVKHFTHYNLKAIHNVGACGRVEVIVSENNNVFRFIELENEENIKYSSGLQDFIEGNYYRTETEAKLEFYKQQEVLAWSNADNKERLFNEAKARHEQVKLLVARIEEELK